MYFNKITNNTTKTFTSIITLISTLFITKCTTIYCHNITNQHIILQKNSEISHHSQHTTSLIYNLNGILEYQLTADNIQYYNNTQKISLSYPIITIFNKKTQPIWLIKAQKAIINNYLLYLIEDINIVYLKNDEPSYIKSIKAKNAIINLTSQDITSNDGIILNGSNFYSTGTKIDGNIKNKTSKITGNIKTIYYIKNEQ